MVVNIVIIIINIVTNLLIIIITNSILWRPSITDELGEENQKLVPSPSQGQRVRVLFGADYWFVFRSVSDGS